ncbi:TonB-dependent receptor [Chitinispirillales bacterium ANBcel5]|uniref:TonB-dependent receptor family protein n=1 Tax=Cellulosispirillum alkaliphilum TaxID=3039283 RepID=UPI002A549944|nr:TonB-dependent receptor [Chitinispirillales bacterium ANBcel5]
MNSKLLLRRIVLFCVAIGFPLFAQTQLPQIDVVGEKEDESEKITGSYETVEQETLEKTKPLSTQDALRQVTGINVVETDGHGFYPRIGIRGLNPDMSKKVLLLEDGAPVQLGPFIDPAAYYNPPIERMERIEVLKGSSSLRYGPSTIGGAINYVTRKPKPGRNALFSLSAGNNDYLSLLGEYGDMWGNSLGSISVLHKRGGGFREMPFRLTDVLLKWGTGLGEDHYLGIKGTFYDHVSNHTYLGLTEREFEENHLLNRAQNDDMFVRRYSVDLNHEYVIADNLIWNTLFYWNNATRDWWREDFAFSSLDTVDAYGASVEAGNNFMRNSVGGRLREFNVMGIDSRVELEYQLLGMENSASFGFRPHFEWMENRRVNNQESATARDGDLAQHDKRRVKALAFYGLNRVDLGNSFTLTPGLRVEYYNYNRNILRWGDTRVDTEKVHSNTVLIPGGGFVYRAMPQAHIFGGVHRGFAPPRVADAIDNSGVDVELDAERSINYELGVRGTVGGLQYELAGFRYDFDNQIVQASEAGGAAAGNYTNAGKTLNQGIEAGIKVNPLDPLSIDVNYTWISVAEFTTTLLNNSGDTVYHEGNRLPYSPNHLANLRLGYYLGPVHLGVTYSYVGKQYSDFANTEEGSPNGRSGALPAYSLLNADITWNINNSVDVYGNVKNILDEKYISSRAPRGIFPGLSRTIRMGTKVAF